MRYAALVLLVATTAPAGLYAQEGGGSASGGTKPIALGGEVGTYAELYGISGAERRRPLATGRLYLRPTFSIYGKFTVALDFMLTTEGRTFQHDSRQRLNQYSVNPDWGWGEATLGDFTDQYTPLTFSGIRVRGGGLTVRRGVSSFSTFGGRTQRAVPGGAVTGSYSRMVAGGRLLFGDAERTSFGVIVLRARDDVGSLGPPADTLFPDLEPDTTFVEDTLQVGVENQFAVTPQENMVVGVTGSLALFDDLLAFKGELAGSGYTRDLRSSVIENEETLERIPGIARTFFTPRVSSNADYAYTLEARVRPVTPLTTTVRFQQIGPGYVSLGAASVLSDRQDVEVRTSLRFRRVRATLVAGHQRDNLIEQKPFTTGRNRFAGSLSLRVTSNWTAALRLNRATLANDAPEPERWVAYGSWQTGLRNTFNVGRRSALRSISLDYTYRTTGDANPLRTMSASQSHTINATTMLAPARIVSVTPTVGVVRSRFADAGWNTRTTYGVGAQVALARGKWVSSMSVGRSQFQQTAALQATVSSRFQLGRRDALIFTARGNDYDNLTDPTLAFREGSVNLRWAHRF